MSTLLILCYILSFRFSIWHATNESSHIDCARKISKNFDSNWLFKFSHHLSDWLNFYTLIINLILSRLYTVMFRGAPCMIMNWPGILFSCIYFQSIFSPRPWIHWAPSSTTPSEKLWEKTPLNFYRHHIYL